MTTIELDQVSEKLPDLLKHLPPGEEITITSQGLPLAQVKMSQRQSWPCKAGSYKKLSFGWLRISTPRLKISGRIMNHRKRIEFI